MSVLAMDGLSVDAGEIVALLGANGSGKTWMLEQALGFHACPVRLFGNDVSALPVEARIALGVGYVPQGRRVFAGLTVRENLEASCRFSVGERRRRLDEVLAVFPMLAERPEARAWLLSGGQQQMLALARAMMNRPRLLLLDEPTLGLAPAIVGELWRHLRAAVAGSTAIVVAEQRAALALAVASRGVVLKDGEPCLSGAAAELLANPELSRLVGG